jgi:hypothetical protein
MACYIVTFEPTGTAASTIKERLQAFGIYCPINASSWAVVVDMTAVQLRDHLANSLPGARIFVIRSGTEAAWINLYGEKNSDWLKKQL